MAEDEKTSTEESATAVAEAHEHPEGEHEHDHGRKPVQIPRDKLTEEARAEAQETEKNYRDLPYEVTGEEKLPHAVQSLKFRVDAETLNSELEKFYNQLRKEVALPGFRKGKAPVKLIRIRMGDEGDAEAIQDIALNVLRQEVLKREPKLISDPELVDWDAGEGQPLELEIHLETEPEVELKDYTGLTVEVERQPVTDEMVDEELERMRHQNAREASAEDAKVEKGVGQTLVLDIRVEGQDGREMKHLGREDWAARNWESALPEEVTSELEGKKAGDEVTVEVESSRRTRRGDEVKFTDKHHVTIKDIRVTKLPELDDEFAKDLGEHDTLQELKDALRKRIEENEQDRFRSASLNKIMEAIVERSEVDAPRSMIMGAQMQSIQRDSYQLARVGLRLEDVVQDAEGYMAAQHQAAENMVKQMLLREELAKKENFEVTDEELDAEIATMAEKAGRKPLAIRAQLEAEKQLDNFRDQMLNDKVNKFLLEKNTVKEVEPKPEEPEDAEDAEKGEKGEAAAESGEKKKPAKKAAKKKAAKKAAPKAKKSTKKKED